MATQTGYAFDKFDEKRWFEATGVHVTKDNWLIDQTISIGFYAITDFSRTVFQKDVNDYRMRMV